MLTSRTPGPSQVVVDCAAVPLRYLKRDSGTLHSLATRRSALMWPSDFSRLRHRLLPSPVEAPEIGRFQQTSMTIQQCGPPHLVVSRCP